MSVVRKVLDLLSDRERKQLFLLIPVVVVMALAEVAGIASIAPFLSLMSDPGAATTNPLLARAYDALGFRSERAFLIATGAFVVVALVVSNAILAGGYWLLARFGAMRNHSISRRLLINYLKQPYTFFLAKNSAALANNILQEVLQVIDGIVVPGLQALAKSVAVVAILILLIVVDPALALLVGTLLGGAYGVIYALSRRHLTRIGRERVSANQARYTAAGEAMAGIKDLKLAGREAEMVERYSKPSFRFARYQTSSRVISTIPKYLLEAVAFGGILAIVLVLLGAGTPVAEIVPVLGLYAFAGYRLLPSLQVVFSGLTRIRYSSGALDEVHAMVRRVNAASPEADDFVDRDAVVPLEFQRCLRLDDVTFGYPPAREPVLRGVSLEIPARTSAAFVGTTGAGKTTLVDVILGLLEVDSGTISVDDVPLTTENLPRWQKQVGYVPQSIFLTDDTVARNIAFGVPADEVDMEAVRVAARIAQIDRLVDEELLHGYDTVVGERGTRLSGGQRQRLGIARALYHDPDVLVLDEATSALDGTTEKGVFDALAALAGDKTIIMIAHRLTTVQACDQIFVMDRGRVESQGTYDELVSRSARFRAMATDGGERAAAPHEVS